MRDNKFRTNLASMLNLVKLELPSSDQVVLGIFCTTDPMSRSLQDALGEEASGLLDDKDIFNELFFLF